MGLIFPLAAGAAEVTVPTASPSPASVAAPSGIKASTGVKAGTGVAAGTGVSETVTAADAWKLLKEFKAALASEYKAVDHLQKTELKELKSSQAARRKEWTAKERDARHKFFKEHVSGPDRRTFVRDYLDRQKALNQILSDEYKQRVRENDVRRKSLKEDQSLKLKEFQEIIKTGKRPPAELWPKAGR